MAIIRPEQLSSGSYSITGSFTGSFGGDGSNLTGVTATAFPAGPDSSVQFRDGVAVSGSSGFVFDKGTSTATIVGLNAQSIVVTGSGESLFLIKNNSRDLFSISQSGVAVFATQSLDPTGTVTAGSMTFTSASFFVGLDS